MHSSHPSFVDNEGHYKLNLPIACYFVFGKLGYSVALRPGDILIFHPLETHAVSSRTEFFEKEGIDIIVSSLYLKTSVVGGNVANGNVHFNERKTKRWYFLCRIRTNEIWWIWNRSILFWKWQTKPTRIGREQLFYVQNLTTIHYIRYTRQVYCAWGSPLRYFWRPAGTRFDGKLHYKRQNIYPTLSIHEDVLSSFLPDFFRRN